jgi:hypothetical protein
MTTKIPTHGPNPGFTEESNNNPLLKDAKWRSSPGTNQAQCKTAEQSWHKSQNSTLKMYGSGVFI